MDDMTTLIIKRLDSIESKMDSMMSNGCAKITTHSEVVSNQREIFSRLRVVENAQAEGRGKFAVACAVIGAVTAFALQWLGKHI